MVDVICFINRRAYNVINLTQRVNCVSRNEMKITKVNRFSRTFIIQYLVNLLTFVIFTSFQNNKSLGDLYLCDCVSRNEVKIIKISECIRIIITNYFIDQLLVNLLANFHLVWRYRTSRLVQTCLDRIWMRSITMITIYRNAKEYFSQIFLRCEFPQEYKKHTRKNGTFFIYKTGLPD